MHIGKYGAPLYLEIIYSIKHINFLINLLSHAQSTYDFFKHIGL